MKKFFRHTAILICFLIASSICMSAQTVSTNDTESAKAYILIEAETGTVLDEYNSDIHMNVGYLSKLMSLLLIAEDIETGKFAFDTELTASQSVYNTKGSVVWLEPSDRMTVDELLKSVIIGNANDALTVLAEASENNIDNFVLRMNSRAFDLGIRDTAFYSPYGYDDEREYSTAHDTAVICMQLAKYDFLQSYFKIWRDFVKDGSVELVNENTLSRTYERHIGFKAEHSERSGYCIAESGRSESGTAYISVVLGAESAEYSLKLAKQLVNKGFSSFKVTAAMFPDEMLLPVKVKNGISYAAQIQIAEQPRLVVPKNVKELSTVVVIPEYVNAPIKKGQKVGTAAFYNGDRLVCESDLVILETVDKLSFKYVLYKMLHSFFE